MSKFSIKLKLTGLEVDIQGSREDIPLIAQGLAQQLTGFISPAAAIAHGDDFEPATPKAVAAPLVHEVTRRAKRKATNPVRAAETTDKTATTINFRNDPGKYGTAKQTWRTAPKCVWLLYVIGEITGTKEASGTTLANTFNKHFKQSGAVMVGNVNRDLGKLKTKPAGGKPAIVGEDTTQTPSMWYLTEEGTRFAQTLVADALGHAA